MSEAENPNATNLQLTKLLCELPRFCCHREDGCEEVLPHGVGEEHVNACQFHAVPCSLNVCNEKVSARNMKEHFDRKHEGKLIEVEKYKKVQMSLKFNPGERINRWTLFFMDGTFLHTGEQNSPEENRLRILFLVDPSKTGGADYHLKIKFKKNEYAFTKTIKPLVYVPGKKASDLVSFKTLGEFSMEIPHCFLHRFMNESQVLEFSYTFF